MTAVPASGAIRKLLVANRGEIAVRILAACREMGIVSVAIFSDADRRALHVQLADEAVCVGPAPAAESYLNQEAIVDAALQTGAGAIHPGYGFLSENAVFAARCRDAELTFVGPSAEAIRLMGDKAEAKRLARAVGVPVVPGYDGEEQADARFREEAERIGYPVLIKAAAGGGGKGMHAALQPDGLLPMLAQSRREAESAFGDGRLLLERLLIRPRHIEVQVLGDEHGALIALGERECSIQRRHQKVIEEAPAAAVAPALRRRLCDLALAVAGSAGYTNAGTVEFLIDSDGNAYFLEMNTRLQVEHAVTEAVYGVDLVRWQIAIAAGERLSIQQADLVPRGHAIECRVYAEDPSAGYLPSTGSVLTFRAPQSAGIRNDAGTFSGDVITPYYDPLLAKLTVYAPDRASAVARMRSALDQYLILGLKTNLPLLQAVVSDPEFEQGEIDIEFLDRRPDLAANGVRPPAVVLFAAVAGAAGLLTPDPAAGSLWSALGPWRSGGQGLTFAWTWEDERFAVRADRLAGGAGWRLRLGDEEFSGQIERIGAGTALLRAGSSVRRFDVAQDGRDVWVGWNGRCWRLTRPLPPSLEGRSGRSDAGVAHSLVAPMPGRVTRVEVAAGQQVSAHQVLVVIEAMKMEHAIDAQAPAIVQRVYCQPGDLVKAGARLIDLGSASGA